MPLVKIGDPYGKTGRVPEVDDRERPQGIHRSAATPEAALWIRVCERKEENFPLPPGRSDDAIRDRGQPYARAHRREKEALFRAIVGNLGRSPGIRPEDLCIVLYEPPVENWAEHGERFAAPPG